MLTGPTGLVSQSFASEWALGTLDSIVGVEKDSAIDAEKIVYSDSVAWNGTLKPRLGLNSCLSDDISSNVTLIKVIGRL